MKSTMFAMIMLLLVLQLVGCSVQQFKRAGYQALYNNQCLRETGLPDCDQDYPDYDEYQAIREAELKGGRIDR